ncbi:MAG TPA: nucleic acid-binding protein [Planctomycetales bacterium]|jgi:predicted nucleic acid-binding protein|nr:nucleic acid-binding protein [Planctomycetales bacterium]
MLVYLDLCSIQRPLDDQTQLRIRVETAAVLGILALSRSGQVQLLSSDALLYETVQNPYPDRQAQALGVLGSAVRTVRLSPAVELTAHALAAGGLKPLDALHLAFAVEAGADYFCTCDDRLLRRARAVHSGPPKLVDPLELIAEIGP